jgi:hypothetical protein
MKESTKEKEKQQKKKNVSYFYFLIGSIIKLINLNILFGHETKSLGNEINKLNVFNYNVAKLIFFQQNKNQILEVKAIRKRKIKDNIPSRAVTSLSVSNASHNKIGIVFPYILSRKFTSFCFEHSAKRNVHLHSFTFNISFNISSFEYEKC